MLSPCWGAMARLVPALSIVLASLALPAGRSAAACPDPSTGSVPAAPLPPADEGAVVFVGSGAGHGLGLSQYGAQGGALLGCSATEILTTYYRGAAPATRTMPSSVGLWMMDGGTHALATVRPNPDRIATATWRFDGRTVGVQGEGRTWTVRQSSSTLTLVDHAGTERLRRTNPTASLLLKHSGTATALSARDGSTPRIDVVNKWDYTKFTVTGDGLDVQQWFRNNSAGRAMDKYLYGVAEIFDRWPAAAQEAQAIAARTFAYVVGGRRLLFANQNDQGYLGHNPNRDRPGMPWRDAVDATRARVIVDADGRAIDALYSASMAGHTEDRRYVWGEPAVSYLAAVDDSAWTNASDDVYKGWAVAFSRAAIAAAFGFDRVSTVEVAPRGTRERWRGVAISGRDGGAAVTRRFTGSEVRQTLRLRSPGFVVTMR